MTFSIRATIRAFSAPDHRFACRRALWHEGLAELARRGNGERESGAFLLGRERTDRGVRRREVNRFVYYDDLDPCCLDTGIIVLGGTGYSRLWERCHEMGLSVIADVHTHPGVARQSAADRSNPMIATRGHIAIIVPYFARRESNPAELGVYEYLGSHQWTDWSGPRVGRFLYIGFWG